MTGTHPSRSTILVVDDDEGLSLLMEEALAEYGYTVEIVNSGKEAVRQVGKHPPDLMLLDLKLKDVAGQKVLDQLRQHGKSPPFIVITGQGDERVAVEMMKQGALDYVVKDTGIMDRLPAVIARALDQLNREKKLAAAQAALRESEKQILAISEREQRRFGAELHDGLGQQLTAIELMCQSLKDDLHTSQQPLEKQMSKICGYLREAIGQTRALARGLAPVQLDAEGLAEALAELALRTHEVGRVKCLFDYQGPVLIPDSVAASHLFRIAQEGVNNALKHAEARTIQITLASVNDKIRLTIEDDGKGLSKPKSQLHPGIGLSVMRHRAGAIGAELKIESVRGQGTKIICEIRKKKT